MSTQTLSKPKKIYYLVCGVLLLLYCFVIKAKLYWGLEYFGDLFLHTQISKNFYLGNGLFYDNLFTPSSHIHNYFVLLLLAPFTFAMGGLGLPAAHVAIYFFAFWYLIETVQKHYSGSHYFGIAAFMFGPIAFWMYDDPNYGWHSELLFFPFSILLASSLMRGSKLFYFFAALMILNREDGPILACAVHCLYIGSTHMLNRESAVKLAKVISAWVLVFIVGMLFLKIVGDGANDRQGKVVVMAAKALKDPELFNGIIEMLWGSACLLFSGLILLLVRGSGKAMALLVVFGLPVILVSLLASFAYLPKLSSLHGHGTSWPYRFGMLWSLVFSAYLFGKTTRIGKSWIFVAVLLLTSLLVQNLTLKSVRAYGIYERITTSDHPKDLLTPKESEFLNCLHDSLPRDTPVTVSGLLTAYFAHLDWSYGGNLEHLKVAPTLIVCDASRFNHDRKCREEWAARSESDWNKRKIDQLLVAFEKQNPEVVQVVRSCFRSGRGL